MGNFLGDSGTYLIGMLACLLSILSVSRNKKVSLWVAIVINIYPNIETLFSMYRRMRDHFSNMASEDHAHMHAFAFYLKPTKLRWSPIKNSSNPIAILLIIALSVITSFLLVFFFKSSFVLLLIAAIYFAV